MSNWNHRNSPEIAFSHIPSDVVPAALHQRMQDSSRGNKDHPCQAKPVLLVSLELPAIYRKSPT